MRKSIKSACIALCAGVLLTGIGAGVAFAEYSSMKIEWLPDAVKTEEVTASAEFTVPHEAKISLSSPYSDRDAVVADATVPQDTIRISARAGAPAYSVEISEPMLDTEYEPTGQFDEITGEPTGTSSTTAYINIYPVSGAARYFFDHKDTVLDGLKHGVVYAIPSVYDSFSYEVHVNPADVSRVN